MDKLKRDIYCILGLPFDSINMTESIEKIHFSVDKKIPCFISTPNLNFLIQSQKDKEFRNSVINSDLSVVDGAPLVWVSRLLKIPLPQRVAGSSLIEELSENKAGNKPLKVFFFGGDTGVAELACEKLKETVSGLQCVGSLNPGFGSIEEMSSKNIIHEINQSDADFIVVSLGAKKGQEWIVNNRNNLKAPVISHLGAVVNFIAGTVNRAPKIVQKTGLEWLWRIKEEPSLWKRYFHDGLSFIYLIVFKVLPLSIIVRKAKYRNNIEINVSEVKNFNISLSGCCNIKNMQKISEVFHKAGKANTDVDIVIYKDSYIDASFLANLQALKNELLMSRKNLSVRTDSKLVKKIFHYSCCDYLLNN